MLTSRYFQPTEKIAKRLQCVVFHPYLLHCHPDVHSSGTNCEWLCWPFKLSMNQASLLASGGYNSMCPKNDLHFNRKALRAEHGKAEMESMISQLESAKTRLEKEVLILTIMILFLKSLCCRSLTKVKFSTDQFRPALGSGGWLIDRLWPCSKNLKTALFQTFSIWHPNTFCPYCLILT